MAYRELNTTREIMHALGGTKAVARLTGSKYNQAHNWLAQEKFPSNMYVAMTAALLAKGNCASPSLWGMKAPAETETV